jgi:hypothetical protein
MRYLLSGTAIALALAISVPAMAQSGASQPAAPMQPMAPSGANQSVAPAPMAPSSGMVAQPGMRALPQQEESTTTGAMNPEPPMTTRRAPHRAAHRTMRHPTHQRHMASRGSQADDNIADQLNRQELERGSGSSMPPSAQNSPPMSGGPGMAGPGMSGAGAYEQPYTGSASGFAPNGAGTSGNVTGPEALTGKH